MAVCVAFVSFLLTTCECDRSYDEDVVIMIAHLQILFYFYNNGELSVDKMLRIAIMVLHKLGILAQQVIHDKQ